MWTIIWQLGSRLLVSELMAEVNEIRHARLQPFDHADRFGQAQVGGVWPFTQGVEDQHIQPFEQRHRGIRDCFGVGDIGEITESKPEHRRAAVRDRDGDNVAPEEIERCVDLVQDQIWFSAVEREGVFERVGESFSQK